MKRKPCVNALNFSTYSKAVVVKILSDIPVSWVEKQHLRKVFEARKLQNELNFKLKIALYA